MVVNKKCGNMLSFFQGDLIRHGKEGSLTPTLLLAIYLPILCLKNVKIIYSHHWIFVFKG